MSCHCESCNCKKSALIVAGVIFLIVALLHLLRIIHPFLIIVNGHTVPHEVSIAGAIIFGLLSLWMFWSGSKRCCCETTGHCCSKK